MQRESHASTSRPQRDEFNDFDTIRDTDVQYGSYSERNNASHGPSASRHPARHDSKGKGKERAWPAESGRTGRRSAALSDKDAQNGDEDTIIQRLPIEALGQIFARLPPAALFACSLVCHDWYDIIHQDSTWRAAFLYHFSLDEALVKVPGNRLSAESWQSEFIARHALAQKWTKSKISTITHDPRVGIVSLMHADVALERHAATRSASWKPKSSKEANTHGNAPSMVSISIPRGVASRSDPFSGKVAKGGFIEGAPNPIFIAGLGGNLDTVTTADISRDGNTIAWGMANGSIHLSRTGLVGRYIHGQGQRATPPAPVGTPLDNHFGIITNVCFIEGSEIMASAGLDGIVKLWDPASGVLWASPDVTQLGNGRVDDIETLAARFAKLSNNLVLLAAGTHAGFVFIWTVDLKSRTILDHRKVEAVHMDKDTGMPVERIQIDPAKSSVLIQYQFDPCFYRVGWQSEGDLRVTQFGHKDGFVSSITALSAVFVDEPKNLGITGGIVSINGQDTPATPVSDRAESVTPLRRTFGNMSYVIGGDDQGRTFIWDWDSEVRTGEAVHPFRQLQGFETKVTCIEVTDLLVLIGTADGTVRAYDILSGRLVRIFNERSAPRQALRHIVTGQADADEEAKWSVSQIVGSREGFVASIGARILAWRAGDDIKARKKTPRSGGRLSSRAERYRTEMELQQDIRESTAVLDHEHQDRMNRLTEHRNAQSFAGIPKALGDMTDEEAFALAMMMSREDEERRQQNIALHASAEDYLDDDLEHLQLEEDELDEDDEDDISDVISRASSYGLGSSRASSTHPNNAEWHSKSYERTNSLPASPYMRPTLSPPASASRSYSKIQVSPRLNPHLFSSPRSPSPVPDLNEVSEWPLPSPASSGPHPIALAASRESPKPQSPSPGGGAGNTWSAVASTGANALSKSPAWAGNGSVSLLTTRLRNEQSKSPGPQVTVAASPPMATNDEMDEELRFVLELSRAEEESRQAAMEAAGNC